MNFHKIKPTFLIAFSLCVLLFIAVLNQDTPFRGEHWAMLMAWINGTTWFDKLSGVIDIEYFGDHRFQPLNSAPMILEYLIFGIRFLPYLFVSISIQLLLSIGVVRLLALLKNVKYENWLELVKKYPVETSVFLILFPTIEVMFWTYFHYIQIGTTLTVFAVGYFLKDQKISNRVISYLLILFASLFYEPFLGILVLFIGLNIWNRSKYFIGDYFLPLTILMVIGSQYFSGTLSKQVTSPPDVSVLNGILLQAGHDGIFSAPGAYNKILFVFYNQTLLIINLLTHTLLPAYANKTNLFEMMPLPRSIEGFTPIFLIGMLGLLFFVRKKIQQKHLLLLGVFFICSGLIIWGRPGAGHYASTQFRYGYIVLPFLFVLFLDFISNLNFTKNIAFILIGYVLSVNASSSIIHGFRLKDSFTPLAEFVETKKEAGINTNEIVRNTTKAILDYQISAPGHNVFLIYNGRGGMGQFYKN